MKRLLGLSAFALSLIVMTSCGGSDDKDTTDPTVTITKPASGDEIAIGDEIMFSGVFADNKKLASVTYSLDGTTGTWTPTDVAEALEGKEVTKTDKALFGTVPATASGTYSLTATVTDAAGNMSSKSVNISLVDEDAPEMTITAPTANQAFTSGNYIKLTGTFTDNVELDKVVASLQMMPAASPTSLKGAKIIPEEWAPADFEISLSGTSDSVDENLFTTDDDGGMIPTDAMAGEYKLTLTLYDAAGTTATEEIMISINE